MADKIDIPIGTRFGWLTVTGANSDGWECVCACGNKVSRAGFSLRGRKAQSCGCKREIGMKLHRARRKINRGRLTLLSVETCLSDDFYNEV